MKKALLLFYFTFCILHFSLSQNPLVKQWDKRFGGYQEDQFHCMQQTADGGYILGGCTYSDSSGDKTQHSWGGYDYWIVKIDSAGNKQWDKRFGGTSDDKLYYVQQTTDGGFILGGESFSDSSGDKTQHTWGGYDYWIVKIDPVGNKEWDKRFGGTDEDYFSSVTQTSDGGYLLGGYSISLADGDKTQVGYGVDFWIVKTDSIGTKLWDRDFGSPAFGGACQLYDLQQTTDGGYILSGISNAGVGGDKSEPNWDPTGYSSDYWILKTDSSGIKQWDKRFGGTDEDELTSGRQTSDGGYILGGVSYSGAAGGDKTYPNWGGATDADYWIVKADSLGNKQWDKNFGGTWAEGGTGNILQTSDGGYLFEGWSVSPISGDKTESNLGPGQTWLIKTDSLGNKQWDKTIFSPGSDTWWSYAVQNTDGCYAIANSSGGDTGGYKTQPVWDTVCSPWCTPDYWIIKFCDTTLTTSITQLHDKPNTFSIYPNPANEVLVISDKRTDISDKALGIREIEIYDLFGRRVLQWLMVNGKGLMVNGQPSITINISSLSPGIYFLKAGNEVRKFVKE